MVEPLEIVVDREPARAVVVRVRGRIDGRTANEVLERSLGACQPGRVLILNLADVTFVSSAGVGVLMVLTETLGRDGGSLRIGPASDAVLTVLGLLNLDRYLVIDASESDALRAAGA
jgi:anti-anti-sigma factor